MGPAEPQDRGTTEVEGAGQVDSGRHLTSAIAAVSSEILTSKCWSFVESWASSFANLASKRDSRSLWAKESRLASSAATLSILLSIAPVIWAARFLTRTMSSEIWGFGTTMGVYSKCK